MLAGHLTLFCFLSLLACVIDSVPGFELDERDSMVNANSIENKSAEPASTNKKSPKSLAFQFGQPNPNWLLKKNVDKNLKILKEQLSDLKKNQGEKSENQLLIQGKAEVVFIRTGQRNSQDDPPKIIFMGEISDDQPSNEPGEKPN